MRARSAALSSLSSHLLVGLLLVGACGDEKEKFADAGLPADAAPGAADAPIDADPHGVVEVTVLSTDRTGALAAGVTVVFLEADGHLAARVDTGADGKASATVLPGASVTAVYPFEDVEGGRSRSVETVVGVAPGDKITIGTGAPRTEVTSFTVNLIDLGSGNYSLYTPCGSAFFSPQPPELLTARPARTVRASAAAPATLPVSVAMRSGCQVQSGADIVAIHQFSDGDPVYAQISNVSFVAGGSASQTADWAPLATVSATWSGIPEGIELSASHYIHGRFDGLSTYASITHNGTTGTATLSVPVAKAEMWTDLFGPQGGRQFVDDAFDGKSTLYSLDVTATLLPWLGTPTFDAATRTLKTPVTGSGTGDAFRVQVEFSRASGGGESSGSNDLYRWVVWAPAAADIVIPPLPDELGALRPGPDDGINNLQAALYDVDGAAGYAAARAHLDAAFEDGALAVTGSKRMRASLSPSEATARAAVRAIRGAR